MFRNVIHFPSRPGGGRHLQPLAEIESYWHVRAAGRPMPERAEIGPHGMEAALPHALLLERIAPGIGRLRLAGQHLRDLMGMELRGMPMSALFEPEARAELAEAIDRALDLPALVHVDLSAAPGLDGRACGMAVPCAAGQRDRASEDAAWRAGGDRCRRADAPAAGRGRGFGAPARGGPGTVPLRHPASGRRTRQRG
ncbi:MAG: PAS domain-containing protein [Paracoccaceae bacterium]